MGLTSGGGIHNFELQGLNDSSLDFFLLPHILLIHQFDTISISDHIKVSFQIT